MCIYTKMSSNISIVNNVFTECRKYGVAAFDSANLVTIKSNLFTGLKMRPSIKNTGKYDYVAAISVETASPNMQLLVRDNLAQGIEGIGYLLAGVSCADQPKQYMINNTVGSAEGGMVPINNGTGCFTFGNLFAYNCNTGIITQFNAKSLIADNITLADNKLNMKIQFAHAFSKDVS